jgi:hypothetical protein
MKMDFRICKRLFIEQNPKYQNLLPVIENSIGYNAYVFTSIGQLSKVLQILKKKPFYILIGKLFCSTKLTVMSKNRIYLLIQRWSYSKPVDDQIGNYRSISVG